MFVYLQKSEKRFIRLQSKRFRKGFIANALFQNNEGKLSAFYHEVHLPET